MHSLFPLIESCKLEVVPEYFIARLKDYARAEHITLQRAAETILPFVQLYNRVLLRSILGCILQRPELITPALNHHVFRKPFLRAAQLYPDLQLQPKLPTTPTITPSKIGLFETDAFAKLLLAYCGIIPWENELRSMAFLLNIHNVDPTAILEEYAAKNGLPQYFIQRVDFNRFADLSSEHQQKLIGLLVADKQFQFNPVDLKKILEKLHPDANHHRLIFDLLTQNSLLTGEAFNLILEMPDCLELAYRNGWQLGLVLDYLNSHSLNHTFDKPSELEQLFFWYFAHAITTQPIHVTGLIPRNLTKKVLQPLIEHPLIAPRFDSVEQFLQTIQEQHPTASQLKVTKESMSIMLRHIDDLSSKLKIQFILFTLKTSAQIVSRELVVNLLNATFLFFALNEFMQFSFNYFSNIRVFTKLTPEFITVTAFQKLCYSCGLFDSTYPIHAVPQPLIDSNPLISNFLCCVRFDDACCYDPFYADIGKDFYHYAQKDLDIENHFNGLENMTLLYTLYAFFFAFTCAYLIFQSSQRFFTPSTAKIQSIATQLIDKIQMLIDLTTVVYPAENAPLQITIRRANEHLVLLPSPYKTITARLAFRFFREIIPNIQQHPIRLLHPGTLDIINQTPENSISISQHRNDYLDTEAEALENANGIYYV